jgi:hypothetical protein
MLICGLPNPNPQTFLLHAGLQPISVLEFARQVLQRAVLFLQEPSTSAVRNFHMWDREQIANLYLFVIVFVGPLACSNGRSRYPHSPSCARPRGHREFLACET